MNDHNGKMFEAAISNVRKGEVEKAAGICHDILKECPSHSNAWHLLGTLAYEKKRYRDAAFLVQKASSITPKNAVFQHDLGIVLEACGKLDQARNAFFRAILLRPAYAEAYYRLGNLFKVQDRLEEAEEKFRKAVHLKPDFAIAYFNLGNVLKKMGNYEGAVENFEKALALSPDYVDCHWNLSLTSLAMGNFFRGWEEYEWRLKRPKPKQFYPHACDLPRWDGTTLNGRRIFIHDEQGMGDTIQFIRYIPLVKALGGTVVFETVKPLYGLLKGFGGIDELLDRKTAGAGSEGCDLFSPLMSLPGVFGTDLKNIPTMVPYIAADVKKSDYWENKLDGTYPKVGLVWAGNPDHPNNHNRSCPLERFFPLSKIGQIRLYGLQKGMASGQIGNLPRGFEVTDLGKKILDFTDTAAIIDNLDLVVSVDTSVAHLAGAMGKPVWVLIPKRLPDWRWLLDRDDSPWYPSMRLYRQKMHGDWETVIQKMSEDLSDMSKKQPNGSIHHTEHQLCAF